MFSHTQRTLSLRVRVVALAFGLTVAVSLPPATAVAIPDRVTSSSVAAKLSATVTVKVSKQVSNQTRVRARVAVVSAGRLPAGTFLVRQGSRTLAKKAVARGSRPSAVLTLPRLAAGKHNLYGVFRTSAGVLGRSPVVLVTSHPGCAWRPTSCGYPGVSNTGPSAGTKFRDVPGDVRSGKGWHYDPRGWIEIDRDGAVLAGIRTKNVSVDVNASNVTIRDNRFEVRGDTWAVALRTGSGISVVRNEIFSPVRTGSGRMLVGIKDIYGTTSNVLIANNEIRHASTGIQLDSGVVRGNYVHSMGFQEGDHLNGIMSNGGTDRLVIRHNTVLNDVDQTDAIGLFQDFGRQTNRVIENNLVAGGGYTIYAGANPGSESGATNIKVTDNRFSRTFFSRSGYWGPATAYYRGGANEWSGNVWDESGRRVPSP